MPSTWMPAYRRPNLGAGAVGTTKCWLHSGSLSHSRPPAASGGPFYFWWTRFLFLPICNFIGSNLYSQNCLLHFGAAIFTFDMLLAAFWSRNCPLCMFFLATMFVFLLYFVVRSLVCFLFGTFCSEFSTTTLLFCDPFSEARSAEAIRWSRHDVVLGRLFSLCRCCRCYCCLHCRCWLSLLEWSFFLAACADVVGVITFCSPAVTASLI